MNNKTAVSSRRAGRRPQSTYGSPHGPELFNILQFRALVLNFKGLKRTQCFSDFLAIELQDAMTKRIVCHWQGIVVKPSARRLGRLLSPRGPEESGQRPCAHPTICNFFSIR